MEKQRKSRKPAVLSQTENSSGSHCRSFGSLFVNLNLGRKASSQKKGGLEHAQQKNDPSNSLHGRRADPGFTLGGAGSRAEGAAEA
jgi:hypothetical protein